MVLVQKPGVKFHFDIKYTRKGKNSSSFYFYRLFLSEERMGQKNERNLN